MRFNVTQNGHDMEIIEGTEQGGGVEELTWWCYTCDPKGERTVTFAHREYPKWRLAMQQARRVASIHAHEQESSTEHLTSPI